MESLSSNKSPIDPPTVSTWRTLKPIKYNNLEKTSVLVSPNLVNGQKIIQTMLPYTLTLAEIISHL